MLFKNGKNLCLSKINGTFIDNAEDLDVLMTMYNLTECSKIYSKTSGTLWNYYKDISIDPITNSESFKYKKSITGKCFDRYDNRSCRRRQFSNNSSNRCDI